jgi:hypothetical protein
MADGRTSVLSTSSTWQVHKNIARHLPHAFPDSASILRFNGRGSQNVLAGKELGMLKEGRMSITRYDII